METRNHEPHHHATRVIFPIIAGIILTVIVGSIVYTNVSPALWLIGWDNLLPELHFPLNISRSLFAVWQEYQSMGLLGGMGHASALPRELILAFLSVFLPANALRYAWTGLMLLSGAIGTYVLVSAIGRKIHPHESRHSFAGPAMLGGIYYVANMATIQIFRAPFEAFVTHHGALPWLLWGALTMLTEPTWYAALAFAMLSFFFSTQGYIPTLFLVYLILTTVLCLTLFILTRHKFVALRRIGVIFFILFTTNAYWLIPSGYFTVTKSAVTVRAKINQMATEEVYLRNKKFGGLADVLTLRNFWFDNAEYNPKKGVIEPMMKEWNTHYNTPLVYAILVGTAYVVIIGFLYGFTNVHTLPWSILGIISFGMLAIDTEPFTSVMSWLRVHVPLLSQFFRFPFTKWGSSVALAYAVLLTFGVATLTRKLHKSQQTAVSAVLGVLLLFTIAPAFQGKLFSDRVTLRIPDDYVSLFSFMNGQQNGRVMILPQPTYWDWKYYDWGNLGSGFLWYAIKQPIADRAFDVWSSESENYYWELSHAIYSKNSTQFRALLAKYDIRYIILDAHSVSASNNRALANENIAELLDSAPQLTQSFSEGNIRVFTNTAQGSQEFVSLRSGLPSVQPAYRWSEYDAAYQQFGDYVAAASAPQRSAEPKRITFPFRDLFTKRSAGERMFTVEETADAIDISTPVEATRSSILKGTSLVYDSDVQKDLKAAQATTCGLFKTGQSTAQNLSENGVQFLRFQNTNQRGCLSYGIPFLPLGEGYLVEVQSRHMEGRLLLFSMVNMTARHTELETYLPDNPDWTKTYFILPPLSRDGLGYNPYISNDSLGRSRSVNDLSRIRIYRIPYDDMVSLHSPADGTVHSEETGRLTVSHPNPAYYKVSAQRNPGEPNMTTTLILSQAYDDGWLALRRTNRFPYFASAGTHVLVNNWENGWTLNKTDETESDEIVLFFWPQLLEWAGLLLLPLPFIVAGTLRVKKEGPAS